MHLPANKSLGRAVRHGGLRLHVRLQKRESENVIRRLCENPHKVVKVCAKFRTRQDWACCNISIGDS